MPFSNTSSKLQYTLIFHGTLWSSFISSHLTSNDKRKRFSKSTYVKFISKNTHSTDSLQKLPPPFIFSFLKIAMNLKFLKCKRTCILPPIKRAEQQRPDTHTGYKQMLKNHISNQEQSGKERKKKKKKNQATIVNPKSHKQKACTQKTWNKQENWS